MLEETVKNTDFLHIIHNFRNLCHIPYIQFISQTEPLKVLEEPLTQLMDATGLLFHPQKIIKSMKVQQQRGS